jgi:aspartate/methionine/tyrosine aminotransferase
MSKAYNFDFGWGDTTGIRKIFSEYLPGGFLVNTNSLGYPTHEGEPDLINKVHSLILDLTGRMYRHIVITNGATSALNAYLHYQATHRGVPMVGTSNLYFGFYPDIISVNAMTQQKFTDLSYSINTAKDNDYAYIVDSPSNPLGEMRIVNDGKNVVWDAAYYSPTYCGVTEKGRLVCNRAIPEHDAMVGSLGKLTGLNGMRVGWLATNDDIMADKVGYYITNTLCGVSGLSQQLAVAALSVDLDSFYEKSYRLIQNNKNEISRLNKIFSNQPIPENGMFSYFEVDNKILDLFYKAGVLVMSGSKIGSDWDHIRINLAKTNEETKKMVDAVLKADRV